MDLTLDALLFTLCETCGGCRHIDEELMERGGHGNFYVTDYQAVECPDCRGWGTIPVESDPDNERDWRSDSYEPGDPETYTLPAYLLA